VYYEGDNDLQSGRKPEQIRDDVKTFVEKVRAALPQVKIYVLSVKPSPSRARLWPSAQETNKLLRELAKETKGVAYIDVAGEMLKDGQARSELFLKDNLHMNAEGYAIWTRIVKAALTGNEPEKAKQ
jgi:lysophospholipase L1-like esterase